MTPEVAEVASHALAIGLGASIGAIGAALRRRPATDTASHAADIARIDRLLIQHGDELVTQSRRIEKLRDEGF